MELKLYLLCITAVAGATKSLSSSTSLGLEKCGVIAIDILWVVLFLLSRIKLYNALCILFIVVFISVALWFLALNLNRGAIPLCALSTSVGTRDGVLVFFYFIQ